MIRYALIFAATPLAAELPSALTSAPAMTGADFESYATGKNMEIGFVGAGAYGIEHYLPNRRVLWHREGDEECQTGVWYEQKWQGLPSICFVYKHNPEHQCWLLYNEGDSIRTYNLKHPTPQMEYTLAVTSDPMPCYSPFLGS